MPVSLGKVITFEGVVGSVKANVVVKELSVAPWKTNGEAPKIWAVTVNLSAVVSPRVVLPLTVKSVVAVRVVVVVSEPGVVMAEGRDKMTSPVVGKAVIWLVVPTTEVTPVVPSAHDPQAGAAPADAEVRHWLPVDAAVSATVPAVSDTKRTPLAVVNFPSLMAVEELFPIVTVPVEEPVFMLVSKLDDAFIDVVAPEIVAPKLPVKSPAEVIVPEPVVEILFEVEIVLAVAMDPKPEAMEPEARAPTVVRDDVTTLDAKVVPEMSAAALTVIEASGRVITLTPPVEAPVISN